MKSQIEKLADRVKVSGASLNIREIIRTIYYANSGYKSRNIVMVNPLRLDRLIKNLHWRYRSGISEKKHVFVIGAPRSGTTLMFCILACHPSFSSVDTETGFFMPGDALNIDMYSEKVKNDKIAQEEFENLLHTSTSLVDFYDRFSAHICGLENTTRFIEKTPFHGLQLPFLMKHFPQAQFINMIRDGRDCYISQMRTDLNYSLAQWSYFWRTFIRERLSIMGDASRKILDVKYEELTANPQQVVPKIMNFLGEPFMEEQLEPDNFAGGSKIWRDPSGQRIAKGKGSGHERLDQKISAKTVGQWREKMTHGQIQTFNGIAGKELTLMGYEL